MGLEKLTVEEIVSRLLPIDDIFFHKLAETEGFCEELLQVIVKNNIELIEVTTQKSLRNIKAKSVTIYFTSIVPNITEDKSEWIKLYMNVEPQDDFYTGYPIIKRGVYYGCRMISSQYEKEFKNSEYAKMKKVYSIWICTDPPKYRQNTIARYFIGEEKIVGDIEEEKESYDLINVIVICLGTEADTYNKTDNKLLRLLNVLFYDGMTIEDKKYILENEFNIPMTVEMKGEVQDMGEYGAGVARRGFEKGMREGIKEGIKEGMEQGIQQGEQKILFKMVMKNKITIEEACEELNLSREKFIEKFELYNA